jgi:hypothetical protein
MFLCVRWSPHTEKTEMRRGTGGADEKQEDSADNNVHHGVDLVIVNAVVVFFVLRLFSRLIK